MIRILLLTFSLFLSVPIKATPLVFAAASTATVMQQAIKESGLNVELVLAASSVLAKQIQSGAPAGIYVSANQAWMDYLEQHHKIIAGSRRNLFSNQLVIIAPRNQILPTNRGLSHLLLELTAASDVRLALGDPDHVPAGIYAKESLEFLGLWGRIRSKAAFAGNVRSALAFVEQGECTIGIVYRTDAQISSQVQVIATLPANSHHPIIYPIAMIRGNKDPTLRLFYQYLTSPRRVSLFQSFGFSPPPTVIGPQGE